MLVYGNLSLQIYLLFLSKHLVVWIYCLDILVSPFSVVMVVNVERIIVNNNVFLLHVIKSIVREGLSILRFT